MSTTGHITGNHEKSWGTGLKRDLLEIAEGMGRKHPDIDDHSEVFAYMNGETIIKPEQIVDYLEIAVE